MFWAERGLVSVFFMLSFIPYRFPRLERLAGTHVESGRRQGMTGNACLFRYISALTSHSLQPLSHLVKSVENMIANKEVVPHRVFYSFYNAETMLKNDCAHRNSVFTETPHFASKTTVSATEYLLDAPSPYTGPF